MPRYIDLDRELVRLYLLNLNCEDVMKEFLLSADVVEVKHGEWIVDETDPERDTRCSICGFVLDDWIQGALYSFCPNCGADMRKERR